VSTATNAASDMAAQNVLDQLILTEYPYPIAVSYRKLLDTKGGEESHRRCIEVFEYGLRTVTLGLLSQYLGPHASRVRYAALDTHLYQKLKEASLGDWVDFLFDGLRAYGGKRELLFMPELYDFYWNTSKTPLEPRGNLKPPFERLMHMRNDLVHRLYPEGEEGWQKLAAMAHSDLRKVLGGFTFLRNYDLIRAVEQGGDDLKYQQFTGQEITSQRRTVGPGQVFRPGWFYLLGPNGSHLELYPLLIFWSGEMGRTPARVRTDAAVYERLLDKAVEYTGVVAHQTAPEYDADLIAWVRQLIFYTLEHIKLSGDRARLSWSALRQAAEELSRQNVGATAGKYDALLYLQRDETLERFRDFLASDACCFVLTGKEGVGKTNFVLSLASELGKREDVCLLLYNAAGLPVPDSATQAISRDFAKYLALEGETNPDLLEEVNRRIAMTGKLFVIVYDAINENAEGRALLERIDQMIRQVSYPWLKLVLTSRPQAWCSLRRGLRLAKDRYYRPPGSEQYEIELRKFTVQPGLVRREELPTVYAKYQQAFDLLTPYDKLTPATREALRDPLTLRLAAHIYRGKVIEKPIQAVDICEQYITALLKEEGRAEDQLKVNDLRLLERDIMPLMISAGHYDNKATASQISMARTNDVHSLPLWELISNDDTLSDGRHVNESYTRLVKHGILTSLGSPLDYVITFKYERFYDYFGGRCLRSLLEDKPAAAARATAYREFIGLLTQKPFLWGVVHSALLADLKDGRSEVIVELAQTLDQPTKDLMVSVLTNYGRDHQEEARALCLQLLQLGPASQRRGLLSLVRPLLGRKRVRAAPTANAARQTPKGLSPQSLSAIRMAKKTAIEVGYNLRIEEVLIRAACDDASNTRAVAMQYIYYLWREDQDQGFRIVEAISRQIIAAGIIPNSRALESCLGVSLMILFWHYKDLERRRSHFARMQQLWRAPLNHILFVDERDGRVAVKLKGAIREGILRLFTRLVVGLVGNVEEATVMFSLPELRAFFPPMEQRKRLMAKFIPHIDAMHGGSPPLADIEPDLFEVLQDRDLLTTYAPFLAIVCHALVEPQATQELLNRLFQNAMDAPPPAGIPAASQAGPMVQVLVWGIRNLMYGNRFTGSDMTGIQIPLDALETMATFIKTFEERYGSRCSTTLREYRLNEIGSYTYFYYRAYEDAHSDLLDYLLDKAVREDDADAMMSYAGTMAGLGTHPAWAIPRAALQTLQLILQRTKAMNLSAAAQRRVQESLVAAFSNVRAYHADVVDDFLAELSDAEMAPEMKRAIQNRGATESLGMLLGTAGAWFARDFLVDDDPYMRNFLKWLLHRATECNSFDEWVRPMLKRLINVVYGGPVFQVPG
jgi:hypothetical protein